MASEHAARIQLPKPAFRLFLMAHQPAVLSYLIAFTAHRVNLSLISNFNTEMICVFLGPFRDNADHFGQSPASTSFRETLKKKLD
jgi:hypothetical protein